MWTLTNSMMKRSSEVYRKMMIKQEVHDTQDSLRSKEDPWKQDDEDEEEGAVSLPSESSSDFHGKEQHPTVSFSLVSVQTCSE